jgi:DNA primase
MARLDIAAIRRDNPLPDIVAKIVPLKSVGKEWMGCCPFHSDRSPSFTIFDDGQHFYCFGCAATGDVLDFVQRAYAVALPEAARMLGAGDVPKLDLPRTFSGRIAGARADSARRLWQAAGPAEGTTGEAYLRFRGIAPPYPPDVRFARVDCDSRGSLPCLVLAVRNVVGDVTGVQRIWLALDGRGKADVTSPKRSLGLVKGGAIRFGDLGDSGALTVCEGPEDALSLLAMLGGAVWASGGLSFLPAMQFPPEVQSIIIGADNDLRGRAGARDAAEVFAKRGLSIRIITPLEGFKDFNDELRGMAHAE